MRMARADGLVAIAALETDDIGMGMAAEEPDQLGPDIAGRADDPDSDPIVAIRPAIRRDRCGFDPRAHRRVGAEAEPLAGGEVERDAIERIGAITA